MLMGMVLDVVDYSEELSFNNFRHCRVFDRMSGLLRLCLGGEFECRVTRLI